MLPGLLTPTAKFILFGFRQKLFSVEGYLIIAAVYECNAVGNVNVTHAHLFSSRYFLELKEKNASTH